VCHTDRSAEIAATGIAVCLDTKEHGWHVVYKHLVMRTFDAPDASISHCRSRASASDECTWKFDQRQPFSWPAPGAKVDVKDWGDHQWNRATDSARFATGGLVSCHAWISGRTSSYRGIAGELAGPKVNLCGQLSVRQSAAVLSRREGLPWAMTAVQCHLGCRRREFHAVASIQLSQSARRMVPAWRTAPRVLSHHFLSGLCAGRLHRARQSLHSIDYRGSSGARVLSLARQARPRDFMTFSLQCFNVRHSRSGRSETSALVSAGASHAWSGR